MTRNEALAKAREARAAKKLEREVNPNATETTQDETANDSNDISAAIAEASLEGLKISLWRECMVAQMNTQKLNHHSLLDICSGFADKYVEFAVKKFQ